MNVNYGIIGFLVGIACALGGWWFGRKKAREVRGLDERYVERARDARANSWIVTTVYIYAMFFLYIAGVSFSSAQLLGILLFIHVGSWGILTIYVNVRDTIDWEEQRKNRNQKLAFFISIFVLTAVPSIFLCISFLTDDWRYVLYSLPGSFLAGVIGLLAVRAQIKKEN
ncbi:hypothetical protein [Priestia taiwanensis]|uniref:DUF2178 domain-containing protein n=1 Tax=Priestia taiwanensis TaxID=1347902 RepID=A0A917ASE5_9BACI|nr:hypothetical protein [Priestia taiwanensis]MBM7363308.1 putative MAPEG superfamily protein [Priestia taiwanensis]GGE69352.1 hypothetical protein GCM10007140_19260 [Priestia taiwanensis]